MLGRKEGKLPQDSPPGSHDDGEVFSPLAQLSPSKPQSQSQSQSQGPRVMMMSTTDRESLSSRGLSLRQPVPKKKKQWDKKIAKYCSLCMAVFLFAGGLTLFISGCVVISASDDSHALGMIIVGIIMLVPGTYGMTKVVKYLQKRQAALQRAAQNRHGRASEELIEEAEDELV